MFRRRLTVALAVLATAAILEGLTALWALRVAAHQEQRSRTASDIQRGFVELSAHKQRLRTWVSQRQLDAGADPAQRDQLLAAMRTTLLGLQAASTRATELVPQARDDAEHRQRREALAVLSRSLAELARASADVQPLVPGTDARAAWDALTQRFDTSDGRDLRQLLAESIAREAQAVQRERAAADRSLAWMRGLWLAVTVTLSLGALLLSLHFARALRRPLDALAAGAQALQRGDLAHRIPATGGDEFAVVARSVNTMAEELAGHRAREAEARQRLEALVQARTTELQGALQALRDVDERRRRLFADISHELRTPTTAIRGEAEITLRGREKPVGEYQAALRRIVDTTRQLGLVIDDLLTMARSDIDALALDRQTLALGPPLADALERSRSLALEHAVRIEGEPVPDGLPPVLADPQRLRQLLTILLDNAVRYSHPGGVVRTRVQPPTAGEPRCAVEVSDEGIGIEPEDLQRVFERHFRGQQARRHRADGSGLGLAIAAALARAHGGEIALSHRPGGGTLATLLLPPAVLGAAA